VRAALLASLALTACQAPLPASGDTAAILGGRRDLDHPQVTLLIFSTHLCSGTLVSSRVVLTAAHCVLSGSATVVPRVYFGRNQNDAEVIDGVEAYPHPEYDPRSFENDIAVVVLRDRARFQPVPLHLTAPVVDTVVTLVGFGLTDTEDRGSSGERMQARKPITSVTDQVIVTGRAICSGDSGGPALFDVDGGQQVGGVISYGDLDCNYGAAQRVDIHAGWLAERLAATDPPSCERDFRCLDGSCPRGDADCPCSSSDGVCLAACEDPESDADCPRGCGGGDVCNLGPQCPAPDPDCGDPCAGEGHCLESCPTRDPDCPAPVSLGGACARPFDCPQDAACLSGVCTPLCGPTAPCGRGETCTPLSTQVSVCKAAAGAGDGGCSAGRPAGGGTLIVLSNLLLLLLLLLLRRRAALAAMLLLAAAANAAPPATAAGDAAFAARRYREAVRAYERAAAGDVDDVEARYRLGVARAAAGDLLGAARAWEAVLVLDPAHERARRNLELARRKGTSVAPGGGELRRAAELLESDRAASAQLLLDRYLGGRAVPVLEALALRAEARLATGDAAGSLRDARALLASEAPARRARAYRLIAAAHRARGARPESKWFDHMYLERAGASEPRTELDAARRRARSR
jgi:hypothetical protein